jgi:hypothetical protein
MNIDEKLAMAGAEHERRRKDSDRTAQLYADVFSTEAGQEVLQHLAKRFDLLGRTFIAADRGDLNALRAAVRDGERAVVNHILSLVKTGKPDFKFSL